MEQHIYYVSLVSHPGPIYYDILLLRKEVLLNDSYLYSDVKVSKVKPTRQQNSFYRRKEGNVFLFNNALNTFYLRLYGVRHGYGPL